MSVQIVNWGISSMLSILKTNKVLRLLVIYLGVTLFSILFTCVYYMNSHGLRDIHMTLLFLPTTLAMLVLVGYLLLKKEMNTYALYAFNMALPAFWVYLALTGIYTMAKTSSDWTIVFLILGVVLLVAYAVLEVFFKLKKKED